MFWDLGLADGFWVWQMQLSSNHFRAGFEWILLLREQASRQG